tara:strand:+ start:668 stop:958 length:291 start_codon:yes stop_codon:yes gene_type:complete
MAGKSAPCLAFDAYRAGFSDAARASDLGVRDYRLESFRDACFSLALETSNGSVAEAARLADVDPRTISRWIKGKKTANLPDSLPNARKRLRKGNRT